MKYEVWCSDDAWTIFPVGDEAERAYLEQTARLTYSVEASSYSEVIERYCDYVDANEHEGVEK